MSRAFVCVFVDTLNDDATTARFHENPGSYPVLRFHDLHGRDIAGRIDGNAVAGAIPSLQVKRQMAAAMEAFSARH